MKDCKKKALIVATVISFPATFETGNMRLLQEKGYEVHVAAGEPIEGEHPLPALRRMGVKPHKIDFHRNPFHPANLRAYRALVRLMKREQFDLVHCHTPVGGVLGRLAARRTGIERILYTAHGFHFYKGAPRRNWLLYYPVEKLLARDTDVLITITRDDERLAKRRLRAKSVRYVPGVGIDPARLEKEQGNREETRALLGVRDGDILLLAVGELNANKNHGVLLRALSALNRRPEAGGKRLKLCIAGSGPLRKFLEEEIVRLHLEGQAVLLGYRKDIPALLHAGDIFLLPSLREGLNVSTMEAMAAGLPVICGDIRGNNDLIVEGRGGRRIDAADPVMWESAILTLAGNQELRASCGAYNAHRAREAFSWERTRAVMEEIYDG